jgi:hypothetical protein
MTPSSGPLAIEAAGRATHPPAAVPGELNLTPLYPQESDAALAYDATDNLSLLYTSEGPEPTVTDGLQQFSWSYGNGSLQLLPVPGEPDLAARFLIADDPHDGCVLLFGGIVNQTWSYGAGRWTQLHPSLSPPSDGTDPQMIYDSTLGRVLLYEGTTPHRNQTWSFSNGSWTELLVHSPVGFPADPVLADDPADGVAIALGGRVVLNASTHLPQVANNSTWEFEHGRWNLDRTAATPPGLTGFSMAFDPLLGRVVLLNGVYANGTSDRRAYAFQAGNWSRLGGVVLPAAGAGLLLAADSGGGRLLAYDPEGFPILPGGSAETGLAWLNATGWAEAPGAPIFPSPRCCMATAYDPLDGYLVNFGGEASLNSSSPSNRLADTWIDRNGNWSELGLTSSPPGSEGGTLVYDAADAELLLYGGFTGRLAGSTWSFRAGNWSRTGLAGGPPSTSGGCMAYDASDGYVLYFGGTNGSVVSNESWAFRSGNWSRLATHGSPPALTGCNLAYDPPDGATILFGGVNATGEQNATWSYQGGNWTQLTTPVAPSDRSDPFYGFDPSVGAILLFGGASSTGAGVLEDLWLFSHGQWVPVGLGSSAGPQSGGTLTFDPQVGGMLLYSGYGTGLRSQLWVLNGSLPFSLAPTSLQPNALDLGQATSILAGAYGGAGPLTFQWSGLPPGCTAVNRSNLACRPNATGQFAINLTVGQLGGNRTSAPTATLRVTSDPSLADLTARPNPDDVAVPLNLSVNATGGAPPYRFAWTGLPPGCLGTNRSWIACAPNASGNFPVKVELTDARGVSANASLLAAVDGPLGLSTLEGSTRGLDVGQSVNLSATVSGGTAPVRFTWSGLPQGCVQVNRSNLSCAPGLPGVYNVTLNATDSLGANATSGPFELFVNASLAAPSIGLSRSTLDILQRLNLTASLAGGTAPYELVWSGLPAGCSAANLSALSCQPTSPGLSQVGLRVTDAVGAVAQAPVRSVLVLDLPTIGNVFVAAPSVDVGQPTYLSVAASVDNGSFLVTWTGLPPGCAPPTNRTLAFGCTPSNPGNYSLSATVIDERNGSASSPSGTNLSVLGDPSVGSPTLSSPVVDAGVPFTVTTTVAVDGAYDLSWSGLPPGCAAPNATALSFGCTTDRSGNYSLGVTLVDARRYAVSAGPTSLEVDPALVVGAPYALPEEPRGNASFELELPIDGGAGGYLVTWSGPTANCTPIQGSWDLICAVGLPGSYPVNASVTDATGWSERSPTTILTILPEQGTLPARNTPLPPTPAPTTGLRPPVPPVALLGAGIMAAGGLGLLYSLTRRRPVGFAGTAR